MERPPAKPLWGGAEGRRNGMGGLPDKRFGKMRAGRKKGLNRRGESGMV